MEFILQFPVYSQVNRKFVFGEPDSRTIKKKFQDQAFKEVNV